MLEVMRPEPVEGCIHCASTGAVLSLTKGSAHITVMRPEPDEGLSAHGLMRPEPVEGCTTCASTSSARRA